MQTVYTLPAATGVGTTQATAPQQLYPTSGQAVLNINAVQPLVQGGVPFMLLHQAAQQQLAANTSLLLYSNFFH